MVLFFSAELPISSEDIANVPENFEGTARVHLLVNEVRIEKVDNTLLGGDYEAIPLIEYRYHDHDNPFQDDGNHTTSSSSSSSLQDDSAKTSIFSPMEIDTEISAESLAIVPNPYTFILCSRFSCRVKNINN
jgi:hypothetical protein